MKTLAIILLMVPLLALAACTLSARYAYTCEGKCNGAITWDVDEHVTQQVQPVPQDKEKGGLTWGNNKKNPPD